MGKQDDLSNPDATALVEHLARQLHRSGSLHTLLNKSANVSCLTNGRGRFTDLPEPQQEAYRAAAQTLTTTLRTMGARLEWPEADGSATDAAGDRPMSVADLCTSNDLAALRKAWSRTRPAQRTPKLCQELARVFLRQGEPLIAYDVLTEGTELWPDDLVLQQLTALALSRAGASERARKILLGLYHAGHTDGETLGVLASTCKDLATESRTNAARLEQQQWSIHFYESGYQVAVREHRWQEAYYTGINAATLAMLSGQSAKSRGIAEHVQQICQGLLAEPPDEQDRYWIHATLGEAALLLGDWPSAEREYAAAARIGRDSPAHLNSTCRQAHRILDHLGEDRSVIDRLFPVPRLGVFTGHMIDYPDRAEPRFPPDREPEVARRIAEQLDALDAEFGYASAACGADILFLEAMLERGGEIHVVLPCPAEEFRQASVAFARGGRWNERFDRVLERAASVYEVGMAGALENPLAFEYANRILLGLGKLRAEQLGAELTPVAVWDGNTNNFPGGAAATVAFWQSRDLEPHIIPLTRPEPAPSPQRGPQSRSAEPSAASQSPGEADALEEAEIVAVLFADAVHFSWLSEAQTAAFVEHYLGSVAELNRSTEHKPAVINTWGDGLFMVFSEIRSAGLYAIDLAEQMSRQDWQAKGLPRTLDIRIGLHAGPAFAVNDPVTRQPVYFGSHVSWAARLEPVTPPGSVYASQAFAALAASERITDFACEYVGQTPLAKNRGTFPTYALRQRRH